MEYKKHWARLPFLYHINFLVFSASLPDPHARISCLILSVWYGKNQADMNLSGQIKLLNVLSHIYGR